MLRTQKIVNKMDAENEIDLFEHYETLPQEVQDVLLKHGEVVGYKGCAKLIADLKPLGYTCDYGLDACPYDLRKINLDIK